MKVLDANFLIDYLKGDETTKEFYEAHGGDSERWVMPVPAYAEALVGEGNFPDGDIEGARTDLAWGEKHAVDEHTAALAGEIADEVGPEGPFLDGMDALIAAVGRELDAPVVSADSDLTHEETKRVIDIEEYRD
jgi:predicted nucleic acid-binding protein